MHINTSTLIYTVQGHVSIHYSQRSQEEDFVLTTELQNTACGRALLICRSNNIADKESCLTTVGMWNPTPPHPSVIAVITSLKGAPSSG